MLVGRVRLRVDEKCVVRTIPSDVHEADQLATWVPARDPAEGVRAHPIPPAEFRRPLMCRSEVC